MAENKNISTLKAYLKKKEFICYTFEEDDEDMVHFFDMTYSDFGAIRYYCFGNDNYLAFRVTVDARIKGANTAKINEYITRVNYSLNIGNFDLDMDNGNFVFRYRIDTTNSTLSEEMIEKAIINIGMAFEAYGDGLLRVYLNLEEPKEAFEKAEKEYYSEDE